MFAALTSDEKTRAEIEEYAQGALRRFGLQSGFQLERKRSAHSTVFVLRGDGIFFEVTLDWMERATFLLIGPMVGGKVPDGYYLDSTGKRARWHPLALMDACDDIKREDWVGLAHKLRDLSAESGPVAMVSQLDALLDAAGAVVQEVSTVVTCLNRLRD